MRDDGLCLLKEEEKQIGQTCPINLHSFSTHLPHSYADYLMQELSGTGTPLISLYDMTKF